MMRVRRSLAAAAPLALAALLTGCTSGPTDAERAAWQDWQTALVEASAVGGVGGAFSADDDAEGIPLDFVSPQHFTAVELRCIGTDQASFTLTYTGTGGASTASQNIVCHEGEYLTPIAIPESVGDLTSFAANATSPDGQGRWVAIPLP